MCLLTLAGEEKKLNTPPWPLLFLLCVCRRVSSEACGTGFLNDCGGLQQAIARATLGPPGPPAASGGVQVLPSWGVGIPNEMHFNSYGDGQHLWLWLPLCGSILMAKVATKPPLSLWVQL